MSTATRQLLGREARQASILRGAAKAFARTGYAATSMEDVAAASGITRLIVYRHFDSKEELYRAVLQRVFGRLAEELVRGLASQRVGVGARTLLTVAREDPDGFVLLWRHAAREPEFAEYARALREEAVGAARDLVATAVADPALQAWAGEAVVGFLVEAVLAWLEHGGVDRDEEWIALVTDGLRAMLRTWSQPA